MSRAYKTSHKKRKHYVYYPVEGGKIVLTPGENGVTEADIGLLHAIDDNEVDEQRRHDYHVTTHLDAYQDKKNESTDDRNKHLADDSGNPDEILIVEEEDQTHQDMLDKLTEAMESLLPQQKELFKKVYIENRTNVDIAREEGVTEAAIRNRLKKIHEKLKKNLS